MLEKCSPEQSPLSEALAQNLHLGYVSDGFVNLGYAAMQLASRRVLVQLERPLSSLFTSVAHQPNEMAALVDHFLSIVRDGVEGSHATRTCAICLEQLLSAYAVILFIQEHSLTAATPVVLAADLKVFEGLLSKHCASGPFASRHRAAAAFKAKALHRVLVHLCEMLETIFGSARSKADAPPEPATPEALLAAVVELRARQPALTREILLRLLRKCKTAQLRGRRAASVLDASEASVRQAAPQDHDAMQACSNLCATIKEALQLKLGQKFSMIRLLETLGTGTRRWGD